MAKTPFHYQRKEIIPVTNISLRGRDEISNQEEIPFLLNVKYFLIQSWIINRAQFENLH